MARSESRSSSTSKKTNKLLKQVFRNKFIDVMKEYREECDILTVMSQLGFIDEKLAH